MRALVLSGRDFHKLLHDSPEIQFKVLRELGERLEEHAASYAPKPIRRRG